MKEISLSSILNYWKKKWIFELFFVIMFCLLVIGYKICTNYKENEAAKKWKPTVVSDPIVNDAVELSDSISENEKKMKESSVYRIDPYAAPMVILLTKGNDGNAFSSKEELISMFLEYTRSQQYTREELLMLVSCEMENYNGITYVKWKVVAETMEQATLLANQVDSFTTEYLYGDVEDRTECVTYSEHLMLNQVNSLQYQNLQKAILNKKLADFSDEQTKEYKIIQTEDTRPQEIEWNDGLKMYALIGLFVGTVVALTLSALIYISTIKE